MGSAFFNIEPRHFASTVTFFGPPTGGQNKYFRHFARSYRCIVRSVRFFRPMNPSRISLSSVTCAFLASRLCALNALHTLFFQMFYHSCGKAASHPHWGTWFWKLHKWIIMSKRASPALNRTEYPHSGAVYGTSNLQKRLEKYVFPVHGPSLEALFALCILSHAFLITCPDFRYAFVIRYCVPVLITSPCWPTASSPRVAFEGFDEFACQVVEYLLAELCWFSLCIRCCCRGIGPQANLKKNRKS